MAVNPGRRGTHRAKPFDKFGLDLAPALTFIAIVTCHNKTMACLKKTVNVFFENIFLWGNLSCRRLKFSAF